MIDRDLAELYGVTTFRLNSDRAIAVNIQIVRIFTRMRELLLTHKDLLVKLERIEKQLIKQEGKLKKHDEDIRLILDT
jgi:hypothetical protein